MTLNISEMTKGQIEMAFENYKENDEFAIKCLLDSRELNNMIDDHENMLIDYHINYIQVLPVSGECIAMYGDSYNDLSEEEQSEAEEIEAEAISSLEDEVEKLVMKFQTDKYYFKKICERANAEIWFPVVLKVEPAAG